MAWLVHSTAAFVYARATQSHGSPLRTRKALYFGKAFRCHCEMPSWRCNTSVLSGCFLNVVSHFIFNFHASPFFLHFPHLARSRGHYHTTPAGCSAVRAPTHIHGLLRVSFRGSANFLKDRNPILVKRHAHFQARQSAASAEGGGQRAQNGAASNVEGLKLLQSAHCAR